MWPQKKEKNSDVNGCCSFQISCFFKKILELPAFELFACHCRRRVAYIVGPIFDACGQVYGFSCAPPIFWTALTPPRSRKTQDMHVDIWYAKRATLGTTRDRHSNSHTNQHKCVQWNNQLHILDRSRRESDEVSWQFKLWTNCLRTNLVPTSICLHYCSEFSVGLIETAVGQKIWAATKIQTEQQGQISLWSLLACSPLLLQCKSVPIPPCNCFAICQDWVRHSVLWSGGKDIDVWPNTKMQQNLAPKPFRFFFEAHTT